MEGDVEDPPALGVGPPSFDQPSVTVQVLVRGHDTELWRAVRASWQLVRRAHSAARDRHGDVPERLAQATTHGRVEVADGRGLVEVGADDDDTLGRAAP